jgi:short subunit dehydrogenase-like uncharacterized protein
MHWNITRRRRKPTCSASKLFWYLTAAVIAGKGGASGGTIESGIVLFQELAKDREMAKIVSHPYSLIPDFRSTPASELPDRGGLLRPEWSNALQAWSGPFIMADHNEKIVRMSNALLNWKLGAPQPPTVCWSDSVHARLLSLLRILWLLMCICGSGKHLAYHERAGQGIIQAVLSSMLVSTLGIVLLLASKFPWLRKKLPMPSFGPSRELMETGYFQMRTFALSYETDSNVKPQKVIAAIAVRSSF